MLQRTGRVATLAATVAAAATMFISTAPASAGGFTIHDKFVNWVVSGSLTPRKLNQTVTLPEGGTFNGEAVLELPAFSGTVTGNVFIPPFNATVKLLALPVNIGLTFTQVGTTAGTVTPVEKSNCPGAEATLPCVDLSVPTKAALGITEVGLFGINLPLACETTEPVTLPLNADLTINELLKTGAHFTGKATIPPIRCKGPLGILVGPALSVLMSGPENPFAINLSPPPPPPAT